jgi:hypothetical protein
MDRYITVELTYDELFDLVELIGKHVSRWRLENTTIGRAETKLDTALLAYEESRTAEEAP